MDGMAQLKKLNLRKHSGGLGSLTFACMVIGGDSEGSSAATDNGRKAIHSFTLASVSAVVDAEIEKCT